MFGFVVLAFIVAIVLPYATLIAVSFSKSWGLDFWKGLTLANYKFILFEYNVTQRAILNSLGLATVAATIAVLLGASSAGSICAPASPAASCSTTPRSFRSACPASWSRWR